MPRIKILPESVKNKIAAGEVIEGPFSVIKELMENSIDAGADHIDIELTESGFKKIIVKDNGTGINKNDLPLAIENHATSKISAFDDIEKILSYGFRGEALAGISSISNLKILSRSIEEDTGAKLFSENGKKQISDFAGDAGTTVIVENLFYNVPARKKFMKSMSAELRKIREIFLKITLVNYRTGFSFTSNNKRIITLLEADTILQRIEQIYGRSVSENLYFDSVKDKAEISGFISKPDFLKSSRSMQILYVNNRLIEYKYLGFLLSKSYEGIALRGTHPVAFLFINIEPGLTDVNIHPAKRELKFFDQNYMNNLILQFCNKILGKVHELDPAHIDKRQILKNNLNNVYSRPDSEKYDNAGINNELLNIPRQYDHQHESGLFIREAGKLYNEIKNLNDGNYFRFIDTVFNTYIITEKDDVLYFIDFHAAHERDIYDSINAEKKSETQSLIFPEEIEMPVDDYQLFLENKEYFNKIGFDIDEFSVNSIIVRGIPVVADELDIKKFLSDILEALKNGKDHINDLNLITAEKLACHSAKRSGDSLSKEEATFIAEKAISGVYEKRCPHGRPFLFKLTKNGLEKTFKRK